MRNLLAFLAAATLTFVGVGWYLDWYRVKSASAPDGHHKVDIDINGGKIADDVQRGVQKGEEKLQTVLEKDKDKKPASTEPAKPDKVPPPGTAREMPKN